MVKTSGQKLRDCEFQFQFCFLRLQEVPPTGHRLQVRRARGCSSCCHHCHWGGKGSRGRRRTFLARLQWLPLSCLSLSWLGRRQLTWAVALCQQVRPLGLLEVLFLGGEGGEAGHWSSFLPLPLRRLSPPPCYFQCSGKPPCLQVLFGLYPNPRRPTFGVKTSVSPKAKAAASPHSVFSGGGDGSDQSSPSPVSTRGWWPVGCFLPPPPPHPLRRLTSFEGAHLGMHKYLCQCC